MLAVSAAARISSMRLEVQTPDEGVHLVSGYSILREGRFSLNAENPPVSKALAALPLLWLNPDLPSKPGESWRDENSAAVSVPFLYRNRLPAETILFWGRMPSVLLALAFGAAFAIWVKRRAAAPAAIVALGMFCADPNFIAHSRYVTSDALGAYLFFFALAAWWSYLESRRVAMLWIASILAGAGVCTKFNLLLLLPLFFAAAWWKGGAMRAFAAHLAIVAGCVWAFHGFEARSVASDPPVRRFLDLTPEQVRAARELPRPAAALLDRDHAIGRAFHWTARNAPVPAYSFWKGLYRLYNHSYFGHRAYLAGSVSERGWWYYFPVAFAVKTPLALLALLAAAAAVRGRGIAAPLLAAPAVYFGVAMTGSIDIGYRHLLPVLPFLYAWGAARVRPAVGAILLLAATGEAAWIHPHYTAFFNAAAGGPAAGGGWLADSNNDWGQDLLKFRRHVEAGGLSDVCLDYFGSADRDYFAVPARPWEPGADCRIAASLTAIKLRLRPGLEQLERCEPEARIGYTIYLYPRSCRIALPP